MAKRLLFGVFMLAAACPPLARAGGAVFRLVAPPTSFSIPAVPPALASPSGVPVPILSAAPSLSFVPLPAAAAPVPVPASLRGMEAMMLRDLARERAQRAEEPAASALDEAKALVETALAKGTTAGRAPWIEEALLLRDLRRDEPRRRAIMKDQELYRESMARAERERRRRSPSLAPAIMAANPAPHVRQETEYTCGPACLRSALLARGLEAPPEAELARELKTDARDGTTPEALAAAARRRGLSARAAEHMTLKGLRRALRKGRTVIVNIQSGGEGHWAVLTGAGAGRLLLMDPYEETYPSALAEDRFLKAWWGVHHGRRYRRAAVVLGP